MPTLVELVPNVEDLLSLEVEDLADIVFRVLPSVQSPFWGSAAVTESAYPPHGHGPGYPPETRPQVSIATAEAISWLETHGLVAPDPGQSAGFLRISRRGEQSAKQGGVSSFIWGKTLPAELLHPELAQKVRPQFLRGDYDVAVFQAFKVVEVHVRGAANAAEANYPEDFVGVALMRQAFAPGKGPLADKSLVIAEQEAMSALFAGAIGHAKNPPGHRETEISPMEAARLIMFASYLLDLVFERFNDNRMGELK